MERSAISERTERVLRRRTLLVTDDTDPVDRARRLWKRKGINAFDEVRRVLRGMASGLERCMYCEDSAGVDIDHFRPLSAFPALAYTWDNYLLACSFCNSNMKRAEFPVTEAGDPLLLDPSKDDPAEHLVLSPSTGEFVDQTVKGAESIRIFGLNSRDILTQGRLDAWQGAVALIQRYDSRIAAGDTIAATQSLQALKDHPFSAVVWAILDAAKSPQADLLLDEDTVRVISEHDQIRRLFG